jgi:hypothetical protein
VRRVGLILLLACGAPQAAKDAGQVNNPNLLHQVNVHCQKWEDGQYFDLGKNAWVYFEWCSKW